MDKTAKSPKFQNHCLGRGSETQKAELGTQAERMQARFKGGAEGTSKEGEQTSSGYLKSAKPCHLRYSDWSICLTEQTRGKRQKILFFF